MLQDFLQGMRQLVFPDNCLLCKQFLNSQHHKQLCDACSAQIQKNTPPFCLTCSRHLQVMSADGLCLACQQQSYAFNEAWSTCLYTDAMAKLLHAFKYHHKTLLRKTFVELMSGFIDEYHLPLNTFDFICPLPLHPTRLRERGYNQSQLLSQALAQKYTLPHAANIIQRTRLTESQTTLTAKQRWTNLRGAFKINNPSAIADKNILLVDDLFTTGATANACAEALKDAGCAYVGVLTLAITE